MEENKTQIQGPTSEEKLWAVLSYIWVLSIVALLVKKEKFIHNHAKQGFLIFVAECFIFVPIIGWIFGWLVSIVAFILSIIGIINALDGKEWKVPIVGEWWDKTIKI